MQQNAVTYNTTKQNTAKYSAITYNTTEYNIIELNRIEYSRIAQNTIEKACSTTHRCRIECNRKIQDDTVEYMQQKNTRLYCIIEYNRIFFNNKIEEGVLYFCQNQARC